MLISNLTPADLRFTIDPDSLGFSDTAELLPYPLPWIGQERAEMAARFGLGMDQPDYNLFVLGEVGSGRSSLLRQAMQATAIKKALPPDRCYLHNSMHWKDRRLCIYLPGRGLLCQLLARMTKSLQTEIPQCLKETPPCCIYAIC